jgi:hypothetical protein
MSRARDGSGSDPRLLKQVGDIVFTIGGSRVINKRKFSIEYQPKVETEYGY